ncbi:MAG: hypothetical protein PHS41_00210 [Victivallaceae bacterium]|nr:hypothetical protein [Victivallaceae bacterium]
MTGPKRRKILLFAAIGVVAAGIRLYVLAALKKSSFFQWNTLDGLDMSTFLARAKALREGTYSILPYETILALAGSVENMILFQMFLGCMTALLIAWIALHLTGKRLYALIAGLAAAAYAPEVMYEGFLLRESGIVFLLTASCAATILAHGRRTERIGFPLLGALTAVAALMRFSNFIWAATLWAMAAASRPAPAKRKYSIAAMLLMMLLLYSAPHLWNRAKKISTGAPIQLSYLASASASGTIGTPATAPDSTASTVGAIVRKLPQKIFFLLGPEELPNNLNYRFVREMLPLPLPGDPVWLFPLGLMGLALWGIRRKTRKRALALAAVFAATALPIVLFLPLGRYRLSLTPILLICFPAVFLGGGKRAHKIALAATGIALVLGYWHLRPESAQTFRSADFLNHGHALKRMPNTPPDAVIDAYLMALTLDPGNRAALVNAFNTAMADGSRDKALTAALTVRKVFPEDTVAQYYHGLLLAFAAQPQEAEKIFAAIRFDQLDGMQAPYCYYYGKLLLRRNAREEAAKLFAKGISAARNAQLRMLLTRELDKLENARKKY